MGTLDRGSGKVIFDEFANALTQMTSMPRSADKIICFYETRRILARLRRLESCIRQGQSQKSTSLRRFKTNVDAGKVKEPTSVSASPPHRGESGDIPCVTAAM